MNWLFEAWSDGRTYGSLGYLLLSLPLGIFGFTVVVVGFSLGLGLLITLVGIPVLVMTLLFVRAFSILHGRLAWSMLQAPMPRRSAPRSEASPGVFWNRLVELIRSRRTWREVLFVLLSLPLGIVGFTLAVTVVTLMFGGLAQPILLAFGLESQIGSLVIDTPLESLIYLPYSIVFLLVGPRILLGIGSVAGKIVTIFLGRLDPGEIKSAVADSLARDPSRDAYAILTDLELRFGRGPFLTPTHVQAALLALESAGRVIVDRHGPRLLYALQR
jgi:hypothetical protein